MLRKEAVYLLENKLGISIVAFLLAVFMFINANNVLDGSNLFGDDSINDESQTIENVPVEVLYDEEEYYVSGLPREVTVELTGSSSNVKRLQATKNFEVVVDLRSREPGEHEVFYSVNGLPENVSATVQPETANVTVQNLVTQNFEVQADINDGRVGSSYQLDSVKVDPANVTVKGGESTMNRIQYVRATLSDMSSITDETVEEAEVTAFDAQYNKLDVVIEPAKVRVEIQVDELKKEVPVSQKVLGEPADGRSVSEIELNRDTIDIYGDKETLESVNSVTAEIDVEGMTTSGTKDVKLDLPENVTKSEPAVLEADVTIEKD